MKQFNIYLIGVGGQGIGLLSSAVLYAASAAGHEVRGVDTHGLAQRGGTVQSQIRIGETVKSPLIIEGNADLVIALERHEALRGLNTYLKDEGALIYYDALWQPLGVRLRQDKQIENNIVENECKRRKIRYFKVLRDDLPDTKMQNIAVLASIAANSLIPEISPDDYRTAMSEIMKPALLKKNMVLFDKILSEQNNG